MDPPGARARGAGRCRCHAVDDRTRSRIPGAGVRMEQGTNLETTFHRWIGPDLELRIRAQPGAKKTEVSGLHGGLLKIRVRARAIEGAANQALLEFLAGELQVPLARCEILSGEKHRERRSLTQGAPRGKCETPLAGGADRGQTSW